MVATSATASSAAEAATIHREIVSSSSHHFKSEFWLSFNMFTFTIKALNIYLPIKTTKISKH